ncbi:MAG: hypothetical protein AB7E05_02120 [Sphingobium sp.]
MDFNRTSATFGEGRLTIYSGQGEIGFVREDEGSEKRAGEKRAGEKAEEPEAP